jgi:hypothetical protein
MNKRTGWGISSYAWRGNTRSIEDAGRTLFEFACPLKFGFPKNEYAPRLEGKLLYDCNMASSKAASLPLYIAGADTTRLHAAFFII